MFKSYVYLIFTAIIGGGLVVFFIFGANAQVYTTTLCPEINYNGGTNMDCEQFLADDPDLSDNRIGNNRASSVIASAVQSSGLYVELCAGVNFQPPCMFPPGNIPDLGITSIGDNSISSIRVRQPSLQPTGSNLEICLDGAGPPPSGGNCPETFFASVGQTVTFRAWLSNGSNWQDVTGSAGFAVCNNNPPCYGEYAIQVGPRSFQLVSSDEFGTPPTGVPINARYAGEGDQAGLRPGQSSPTPTITPTTTPTTTPTPTPGDTTAPVISNVKIINITTSSATVTWTTNEPATGQVEYCLNSAKCGKLSTLNPQLTTGHSINLIGLAANTSYYIWARSKDGSGNLGLNGYYLFRTLSGENSYPTPTPTPTAMPTVIVSNVQVINVTRDSATITWQTDRPADSKVSSCSISYFCFFTLAHEPLLAISHGLVLTSLKADKNYYIQVSSVDAEGNRGKSGTINFKTQPGLIMSGLRIESVTSSSVTVAWDTNYSSNSGLIVCNVLLFCYFSSPVVDPVITANHRMTISGLKRGTSYYYQAVSLDPAGYRAKSSFISFKTAN